MQKSKFKNKNERISLKDLKIAVVVEELTQLGGAERILDYILEEFPRAPIFTLVYDKAKTLHRYDRFDVRTSFIQKLPLAVKRYKWYLVLMPKAVESFNLDGFDIVLSITSALVKGVKTGAQTLHFCYCNTPTRWLWSDRRDYLRSAPIPFFVRPLMPPLLRYLKKWDIKASRRPDYFIANSENVRRRIQKYYRRDSFPIFVPVDCDRFRSAKTPVKAKYFLVVSRLEPYKKVDLVINAFEKMNLPLKVVGSGTRFEELRRRVSPNISLVGRVSDEELAGIYQQTIAMIFTQEEDAGIVPLEAMASGVPVVAFSRGGVLETVINGKTGVFFHQQSASGLIRAVRKFQKMKFDPNVIRRQAEKFDKTLFKEKLFWYIEDKWRLFKERK